MYSVCDRKVCVPFKWLVTLKGLTSSPSIGFGGYEHHSPCPIFAAYIVFIFTSGM